MPRGGAASRSTASEPAGIRTTRLTSVRREHAEPLGRARGSPPASTIALRSRCAPSASASSSRRPASRLTTPPGTSETASTSPRSRPGERPALRAVRHSTVLPAASAGAIAPGQAEQLGLLGRHDADDAGRLRRREGQERRRDGVHAAEHRVQLVGPARVVHQHVDGGRDLLARRGRLTPRSEDGLLRELLAARLQRLGRAVEHLPAVVGGLARPAALRGGAPS